MPGGREEQQQNSSVCKDHGNQSKALLAEFSALDEIHSWNQFLPYLLPKLLFPQVVHKR